jgi:hypothetical protein
MKSKYIFILATIAIIFLAQAGTIMADNLYEQNYSVSNVGEDTNAHFVVQELKYEPYPVNAGDTFDLWVKVQNIGQNDAKNSQFKIDLSYPFSSDNTTQNYGIIFGTTDAYLSEQAGETSIQSNQAVIKFVVKVTDDAPAGENTIKFEATDDSNSGVWYSYNLPITIKNSQITYTGINSSSPNLNMDYTNWVYAAIGFVTGIFIMIILKLILQKKKGPKHK